MSGLLHEWHGAGTLGMELVHGPLTIGPDHSEALTAKGFMPCLLGISWTSSYGGGHFAVKIPFLSLTGKSPMLAT